MPHPRLRPLVLALSLATVPAFAQEAPHAHAPGHDATATAAPAAPAGRWATDAPLREGMREIGGTVGALGHYEMGHLESGQAVMLAGQVEETIAGIVANCRLEPDADAALHVVLAALAQGAARFQQDPDDHAAVAAMRQALADYARLFDDPGFEVPSA